MEHECIRSKEISRIVHQIDGNGSPGLVKSVVGLETKIDTLIDTVGELRTIVSGLARFEAETSGIDKYKKQQLNKNGIIISSILGVSAIIVTVIITFVK